MRCNRFRVWLASAVVALGVASCEGGVGNDSQGSGGTAPVDEGQSGGRDGLAGANGEAGEGNSGGTGSDGTEASGGTGSGATGGSIGGLGGDGGAGGQEDGDGGSEATGGHGPADDEFGVLSGDLGVIDEALLLSALPTTLESTFDCGDTVFAAELLSEEAALVLDAAGDGSAGPSEALAFEVLRRGASATLRKTEDEVEYDVTGPAVDFLVEIAGQPVGVSVVRALTFPLESDLSVEAATVLLEARLEDLLVAQQGVATEDAWVKGVLVVIAYDAQKVDAVLAAYATLDSSTIADTLLLIVRTDGNDAFLY